MHARAMVGRTRAAASKPRWIGSGVHHVDLVVSSIERSLPFYRELLGPLGWHGISEVEGERGETIWYLSGRDCSIGLRETQSEPRRRRPLPHRPAPPRVRGRLARSRRRACRLAARERRVARERAAGIHVHAGVLRSVLLRPGRAEARDPPCPGPRGLNEQRRPACRPRLPNRPRLPAAAPAGTRLRRARPQLPCRARSCRCPATPSSRSGSSPRSCSRSSPAASDGFDAHGWCIATTWLTAAYILSRGIAKASRVLEQ